MLSSQAKAAQKALSLKDDMVFKLLLAMTVLLGWVAGVVAGGLMGLENAYQQWQLDQNSKVSVYLMPESSPNDVEELLRDLRVVKGVEKANALLQDDVQELLQPYFSAESYFPLPIIVEARVNDKLSHLDFEAIVKNRFPTAEIDDARELLQRVSTGVRTMQGISIVLAFVILLIMALLVSLTVRAGLRAQQRSLKILQYIGATDTYLSALVVRQVLQRSLLGWAGAVVLAVLTLLITLLCWSDLMPYMSPIVWFGVLFVPLLLVAMAVLIAYATTGRVVRTQVA